MKNLLKSVVLMVITLFVIFTACGGGGSDSGGGDDGTPAGTFTKVLHQISTGSWGGHFSSVISTFRVQHLYTSAMINGSGNITAIAFKANASTTSQINCSNVTIKMGHTSLSALTTTYADNAEQGKGSLMTVLNDKQVVIPVVNAGDYFEIKLDKPFCYNGADNLVIDFIRAGTCDGNVPLQYDNTLPPNQALLNANITSPTGSLDSSVNMKLTFEGGDNKIDYITSYNGNNAPLSTISGYNKVQMLYYADSISGSGLITGIALQINTLTTEQTYTYTMKLGHSTMTNMSTTWANNFNAGSPVTVANSVSFTVPEGVPAGDFIWLPIPDGSFTYNGTDNLVIELVIESASGGVSLATHPTANVNRLYGNPANSYADFSNLYTHQIELRFYGGTTDVITDGTQSTNNIFPVAAAGRLSLYRATEIGTSGTITSIFCRLNGSTTSVRNYSNYKVIIGHSDLNALQADPASGNYVSRTEALSGSFSVDAGLMTGDWIEIPLTVPFAYDGKSNLAVWLGTTAASGAASITACKMSSVDDTRYYTHTGVGKPGDSALTTLTNNKLDMKFTIVK